MTDASFRRFGGMCCVALAVTTLAYALLVFLGSDPGGVADRLSGAVQARATNQPAHYLLGISGLLLVVAVMAVFERVRHVGGAWARWGAAMGVLAGGFTAAHGFWDALRVPVLLRQWDLGLAARQEAISAFSGLPNPVDPRGLGAFLMLGLFVLVAARALALDTGASGPLASLGLVYGAALVITFAAGLVAPAAARAVLAALTVGVLGPVWWALVGRTLWQEGAADTAP